MFTKSTKFPQSPEPASPSSPCSYKKMSMLKGGKKSISVQNYGIHSHKFMRKGLLCLEQTRGENRADAACPSHPTLYYCWTYKALGFSTFAKTLLRNLRRTSEHAKETGPKPRDEPYEMPFPQSKKKCHCRRRCCRKLRLNNTLQRLAHEDKYQPLSALGDSPCSELQLYSISLCTLLLADRM